MVNPVDHIADVVQVAGNPGELRLAGCTAEIEQQVLRKIGRARHMGEAVLRVAHGLQRFVRFPDIGGNLLVAAHTLFRDQTVPSFLHFAPGKPGNSFSIRPEGRTRKGKCVKLP